MNAKFIKKFQYVNISQIYFQIYCGPMNDRTYRHMWIVSSEIMLYYFSWQYLSLSCHLSQQNKIQHNN